jgi:hypothetical protein
MKYEGRSTKWHTQLEDKLLSDPEALTEYKSFKEELDSGDTIASLRGCMVGVKDTKGKPDLSLIPYAALVAIANIRTFGNKKYGSPSGWYNSGVDYKEFVSAAMRHIARHNDAVLYGNGKEEDSESGLKHLDHAITSLALAIALRDRPKGE